MFQCTLGSCRKLFLALRDSSWSLSHDLSTQKARKKLANQKWVHKLWEAVVQTVYTGGLDCLRRRLVLWSIGTGMITQLTFSCDEQTWRAIWYTASKRDECKTHDCIRDVKCISNNSNHPNEGIRRESKPSNTNYKRNSHPLLARFLLHIRDGEKICYVDWKAKEPAKSSR